MNRNLTKTLKERLKEDRGLALLGPRQTGKSYLLKKLIEDEKEGVYLNFDDPLLREEVASDPLNYLRKHYVENRYLFIDEAAKVPPIFDAIKILIDEQGNKPSHICLANSGNFLLMKKIKETLAGRISLLSLYPLSWREFTAGENQPGLLTLLQNEDILPISQPKSFTETTRMREERLLWGGFPVPVLSNNPEARIRWINDYLRTYVFPILIEQFNVRSPEAFEKCARLLFLQSGQILNYNRLAQEVGISQPTVKSYVHQLKAMMLIITLETYFNNPRKRLLKQPKVHVVDPLLLRLSLGTNFNLQTAKERGSIGAIYESFVASEIVKTMENAGLQHKIYSWRTADKAEVDIILEANGKILPIEIKYSETISRGNTSGINAFLEDNPACSKGYIIYPGKELVQLSPQVAALPDWWFFGAY